MIRHLHKLHVKIIRLGKLNNFNIKQEHIKTPHKKLRLKSCPKLF